MSDLARPMDRPTDNPPPQPTQQPDTQPLAPERPFTRLPDPTERTADKIGTSVTAEFVRQHPPAKPVIWEQEKPLEPATPAAATSYAQDTPTKADRLENTKEPEVKPAPPMPVPLVKAVTVEDSTPAPEPETPPRPDPAADTGAGEASADQTPPQPDPPEGSSVTGDNPYSTQPDEFVASDRQFRDSAAIIQRELEKLRPPASGGLKIREVVQFVGHVISDIFDGDEEAKVMAARTKYDLPAAQTPSAAEKSADAPPPPPQVEPKPAKPEPVPMPESKTPSAAEKIPESATATPEPPKAEPAAAQSAEAAAYREPPPDQAVNTPEPTVRADIVDGVIEEMGSDGHWREVSDNTVAQPQSAATLGGIAAVPVDAEVVDASAAGDTGASVGAPGPWDGSPTAAPEAGNGETLLGKDPGDSPYSTSSDSPSQGYDEMTDSVDGEHMSGSGMSGDPLSETAGEEGSIGGEGEEEYSTSGGPSIVGMGSGLSEPTPPPAPEFTPPPPPPEDSPETAVPAPPPHPTGPLPDASHTRNEPGMRTPQPVHHRTPRIRPGSTTDKVMTRIGGAVGVVGGIVASPRSIARTQVENLQHAKGVKGLFKYTAYVTMPDGTRKAVTVNAIGRRMAMFRLKLGPTIKRIVG